jgi:hypothetical protein
MREALNGIAGIDLTEPSMRESLAQHLVRFVRGGLAAGRHESEA